MASRSFGSSLPTVTTTRRSSSKEEENETSSSLVCPFSRHFPRYVINLTPIRAEDENNNGLFAWPWQKGSVRNQLENRAKSKSEVVEVIWKEKVDGVAALAFLWRAASDLQQQNMETITPAAVICALPDARIKVVRQWVDLIEWLFSLGSFPTENLSVEFEITEKIPTVTMTVQGGSGQVKSTHLHDHDVVTARTKSWVKRVLVKLGICPFTKSSTMSGQGLAHVGVPVGSIAYHTSSASSLSAAGVCELMADTWEAIKDMLLAGPKGKKGVSSILLAAPEFDGDFALWSGPVFALLEAGVLAAQAEKDIGVVCFHPTYMTPDGSSFPGFGHMHSVPRLEKWMTAYRTDQQEAVERRQKRAKANHAEAASEDFSSAVCPALTTEEVAAGGAWQRRTPHATINVLRANQLEAAEEFRSSPILYAENILKLVAVVGSEKLEEELDKERNMGV